MEQVLIAVLLIVRIFQKANRGKLTIVCCCIFVCPRSLLLTQVPTQLSLVITAARAGKLIRIR
jgi:hypothetical protein